MDKERFELRINADLLTYLRLDSVYKSMTISDLIQSFILLGLRYENDLLSNKHKDYDIEELNNQILLDIKKDMKK